VWSIFKRHGFEMVPLKESFEATAAVRKTPAPFRVQGMEFYAIGKMLKADWVVAGQNLEWFHYSEKPMPPDTPHPWPPLRAIYGEIGLAISPSERRITGPFTDDELLYGKAVIRTIVERDKFHWSQRQGNTAVHADAVRHFTEVLEPLFAALPAHQVTGENPTPADIRAEVRAVWPSQQ
jgi:hypothetical protein